MRYPHFLNNVCFTEIFYTSSHSIDDLGTFWSHTDWMNFLAFLNHFALTTKYYVDYLLELTHVRELKSK